MISLRDRVEIHSTPKRIFSWLEKMPQLYTSWHPDHIACRVIRGSLLEVGSEVEIEEILHGKRHRLRFRTTMVVPDERVEFDVAGMGRGAFQVEAGNGSTTFIAELDLGSGLPIIGPAFDWIFSLFFSSRMEAMKEHMAEEGENLKALLESEEP